MRPNRLLAVALFLAAPALAQSRVPAFELERLTLNPAGGGGLLVGGGDVLPERHLRLSLTGHFERDPLVIVDPDNHRLGAMVGGRVTAHLAVAYTVTSRLELGLQLPLIAWQGGSQGLEAAGLSPVQSFALGTPWLQARWGLLTQADGAPVDLAVGALVGLPLGSAAAFSRDDGVSVIPRIGIGRKLSELVRVGADLGAWIRPATPLSVDASAGGGQLGPQLDLGLGATTLGDGVRGELSLRSTLPLTDLPASTELLAGVRFPRGPIELYALAGPGFGRTPGIPQFRVLAGIAFSADRSTPAPAVVEEVKPPIKAEPPKVVVARLPPPVKPAPAPVVEAAPPRCAEGRPYVLGECPDLDVDGDGVKNGADRCPEVKGSATAVGCPDGDGDGLADEKDRCPAAAGPAELEGCPDTDKDGLADADDGCPVDPGPKELRGCPLRDADRDGVADAEDNCPAEPGPPDNQGCPAKKKQLVIITREKLVIKDRVYFNTAKATIQKRSFGLLDQVAAVLLEHPEVSRIIVEGHTDSQGKAATNRKLSQDRAESVRARLVKQGVGAARLEAKGYGPDRPVADNQTKAGREQNRRVEFVIATDEKADTRVIESP
ncbi:MAG: OmpA family protein [Myxococcaceae bacterium]